MKASTLLALLLSVFSLPVAAQSSTSATYRLEGNASLMSNYVDSGLTYTDGDPALQGAFWYNFGPQFRLGVWGSNVSFDGTDTHFLLKLNGELKVNFTPETSMILGYSDNRYYKSEFREGNTLSLKLDLYGYGIRYEKHSNFFGTRKGATSYAFGKTWPVFQTWNWQNLLGYMTMEKSGLSNYFFVESYLGTRSGPAEYQIGASYNSSASQLDNAGRPALIFKASVGF